MNVPVTRLLLIAAALVATISIGVTTMRTMPTDPPPPAQGTAPQPDISAMIPQIEARLKANPQDAQGWRMLGASFFETQRFAESATAYKRAAELEPGKADIWSNLGEALVLASQGAFPADAKAAFTNALQRDPKDIRARYFLSVEKDMRGDHNGAIDGWIALLKDSPPDAPWQSDVRSLIASVATKEKIDVRGRMAALPALPAQSPSAAAQQQAMVQSMVSGLAAKLEANPADVDGWVMLMRSYSALGRAADASAAKKKALSANPAKADTINAAAAQLGVN